jgi:DNA-binding NarL/FixJ family response regulator
MKRLSKRQLEVARLKAKGLTHQEIADELGMTVATVKTTANNIYNKLDVRNVISLLNVLEAEYGGTVDRDGN